MSRRVLADTGAIVAYLSARDQWNKNAVELFRSLPKPFYTCEAVLTETCFLLRGAENGPGRVFQLLSNGILAIEFGITTEITSIDRLIRKYKDVPMSLADACLVRMSELAPESSVFTFDTDFTIYRRNKNMRIQTVPDSI